MDAFPHFITSDMCLLDLDLGQKGLQKLLGAFSVLSGAWPLSRIRVGHAVASFGVFLATRSLQSCVRVICILLKARDRVIHAVTSLPFRAGMRSHRPCDRVTASFFTNSVLCFPSIFVCFLFIL
ncbi:uncharacterized protein DS421_16g540080 [Arachis hypogaea]|nr:uncharacterized protein DS421_16g540080 [Arachis hypogaea]